MNATGLAKDRPEYGVWADMRRRCAAPNSNRFKNYGGRGIKVCPEWQDSFWRFLEDVGPRPSPKHSIDRIDNNGNYEPSNVRWATDSQQRTNRTDNARIIIDGRSLTVSELARESGVAFSTIKERRKRGWPTEYLAVPVRAKKPNGFRLHDAIRSNVRPIRRAA